MTVIWALRGAATAAFAAIVCAGLIVMLRPALQRYALAKPNARSSHREPTPQGGGIAVIAATLAATFLGLFGFGAALDPPPATFLAAVIGMACIGAVDDIRSIEIVPRLILQALAIAAAIYALPDHLRLVPVMPWWFERALLFVGGMWFVNLVNFMDGIDWMTVVEVVPIAATLAVMGYLGAVPLDGVIVALALGGALIGFAYFNRPVATLFLGDVGSLPIGLLLGWLLVLLAGNGYLAAALLLPLYYLADASVTLVRRLLGGERIWHAHRTHFYQLATARGFSVTDVVALVLSVNVCLCALAVITVVVPGRLSDVGALLAGALLVAWLLVALARGKKSAAAGRLT
jgi:UDP-N-acetylmuramyl pentapeptide phosphotransferase/UDP-N-acetylglucosamine-1-phosphate transferase